MNKKEFVQAMTDYAGKYGEINVSTIERSDNKYKGLAVKKIGVPVPVVNLDKLYKDYKDEVLTLDDCFELIDGILSTELDVPFDMSKISEWDIVVPFLRMKVAEEEPNCMYDKFHDLYMYPCIEVSDEYLIKITEDLLKMWGVTRQTLFETAALNAIIHRND